MIRWELFILSHISSQMSENVIKPEWLCSKAILLCFMMIRFHMGTQQLSARTRPKSSVPLKTVLGNSLVDAWIPGWTKDGP